MTTGRRKRRRNRRGDAHTPQSVKAKKEGVEVPDDRAATDIVQELAETYLRVGRAGHQEDNLAIHCPFHKGGQERKPSAYLYFGIDQDKPLGYLFCFTCGDGWPLVEVLESVGANKADIDLAAAVTRGAAPVSQELAEAAKPRYEPGEHLDFSDVKFLPESAIYLFDRTPLKLVRDGFARETLAHNEVGFDEDRLRITFPIRDHLGRLVAVSGRAARNWVYPRYKVYVDEFADLVPGYDPPKGKVLWGLHHSFVKRVSSAEAAYQPLIICEGFKAKMWVDQALTREGLGDDYDVVALMGTALTDTHKELLQLAASRVIFFLDNDRPGVKAMYWFQHLLPSVETLWADYNTLDPLSPDDMAPKEVAAAVLGALRFRSWRRKRAGMGEDVEEAKYGRL